MKIIFLSPHVTKGARITYLFCNDGIWIAIAEKDENEVYLDTLQNWELDKLEQISEKDLISKIPKLRNHLDEEDQKFIKIDYKNDRIYVNPKHDTLSPFTNTTSRATNQSNFKADAWTYIKNRKTHYLKIALITIALLLASYFISWAILILLFWILFYKYFGTLSKLDAYNIGTLNASIVITTKPTRIAVLTDATKGFGNLPIVRVQMLNLPKQYNVLNQRIPSSCGYQDLEKENYWDYIIANPMVYATNDKNVIHRKINEIPNQDWINLENWIKVNPRNFHEGYYPIITKDSNWYEYENPRFFTF